MPWISRTGNKITRIVFHMVTGQTVSDTQTGLRAFSGSLLDFMESISGSRYEYEMNVLIACGKKPVPIVEVPVTTIYHDRRNSCSHFRKVRDSVRIYRDMFRFTLSSLTSFVLDYTLFVLLTFLMPKGLFWALAANVAARLVSGYYNYTMNCRFVFGVKRDLRTAADYIGLALLILLLNNLFLTFFMEICYIPPRQAKMITEISLFLISWLVQKKIIFSKISEQKAIPLRRVEKW